MGLSVVAYYQSPWRRVQEDKPIDISSKPSFMDAALKDQDGVELDSEAHDGTFDWALGRWRKKAPKRSTAKVLPVLPESDGYSSDDVENSDYSSDDAHEPSDEEGETKDPAGSGSKSFAGDDAELPPLVEYDEGAAAKELIEGLSPQEVELLKPWRPTPAFTAMLQALDMGHTLEDLPVGHVLEEEKEGEGDDDNFGGGGGGGGGGGEEEENSSSDGYSTDAYHEEDYEADFEVDFELDGV